MKKFFALVMALVMALSLTTVAWGADENPCVSDPCAHEAAIGTAHYDKLEDAVAAATADQTVLMLTDATIEATLVVDGIILDGNGKTLIADAALGGMDEVGTENDNMAAIWSTVGCTIKNLTVEGGWKGVIIQGTATQDTLLENVTIVKSARGLNFNFASSPLTVSSAGLTVKNSTISGWCGIKTDGDVVFENTTFVENESDRGSGLNPRNEMTLTNCTFDAGTVITTEDLPADDVITVNGGTYACDFDAPASTGTFSITAGTFTDDVSEYVVAGKVLVNGVVANATPAGNTTTYDIKDLTITDPYGAKVPTTGLTAIVKVASVTNTSTVNGKTTTTFVPAWYQVSAGSSAGTFVECDKSVADYMFTIKGAGSVYVREMAVPAAFDATPVTLYTAPKTATCGMVGANEDVYVVVNGKYYAAKNTVVPGTESYALVNGKMVVYYGEATAKDHNWTTATVESYAAKTGAITSVKCADCKGVIAVYTKAGSFDGNKYVKITSGVAANYYYVAGAVAVQAPVTGTTSSTVQSAETFDAGIAMYVGMSVMAAAGSVVVFKKRED